ncbi:hypothetical protein ACHFJ0_00500 [Paracoccus sp. NGMCC 1.201697]|uniref:Uncharacterized protein n=1 Tax=Paracoccus broussonetiae subsp. drimophilus TaxID=3373869 RepID=A0ABW7LG26_9RHOB
MSEIIPHPAGLSLVELSEALRDLTGRHAEERVRFALTVGSILSAGRALCESPDCGIAGDNPNVRFGKWVAETVSETPMAELEMRTARNYMALSRAFGHLPVTVVMRIGLAHGYKLAAADADSRAWAIEHVQAGGTVTASDLRRLLDPPARPTPAPAAAQAVEDAVIIDSGPAPALEVETAPANELAALRAEIEALRVENARLKVENASLPDGSGLCSVERLKALVQARDKSLGECKRLKRELEALKATPVTPAQADDAKVAEAAKWEKQAKARQAEVKNLKTRIARMTNAGAVVLTEDAAKNIAAALSSEGSVSKERKERAATEWNAFRQGYFK